MSIRQWLREVLGRDAREALEAEVASLRAATRDQGLELRKVRAERDQVEGMEMASREEELDKLFLSSVCAKREANRTSSSPRPRMVTFPELGEFVGE